MAPENCMANLGLFVGAQRDQTNDARMGSLVNDSEFTEILVERNKYAPLIEGHPQDGLVAGILRQLRNGGDVMAVAG